MGKSVAENKAGGEKRKDSKITGGNRLKKTRQELEEEGGQGTPSMPFSGESPIAVEKTRRKSLGHKGDGRGPEKDKLKRRVETEKKIA